MRRTKSLFVRMISVLTLCMAGYITYCTFFKVNRYAIYLEKFFQNITVIYILGAFLFSLYLVGMFYLISKCSEKKLNLITVGLWGLIIILQWIMMSHFEITQITDSYIINDQAILFAKGKQKYFDTSVKYFTEYPNNYFITILTSWFYRILDRFGVSNYSGCLSILNALFINLGIYLTYLIVKCRKGKKSAVKVLLLCAMNPLYYLLLFWYYTSIYCIPVFMGLIYIALKMKEDMDAQAYKHLTGHAVLFSVLLVLGYFIRPICIIPVIALVIVGGIHVKGHSYELRKTVLAMVVLVCSTMVLYIGINRMIDSYIEDDTNNFPVTHWIMMGLHGEGRYNLKDVDYTNGYPTKEEKKEANIREIKRTLAEYGVAGTYKHVCKKLEVTWSDGMADASARLRQDTKFTWLYKFLVTGKNDILALYCQIFRIVMFLFILVSIIAQIKESSYGYRFFLILTLFGSFLFYILWEGKEVYSTPFLLFMFLIQTDGIEIVEQKVSMLTTQREISKVRHTLKIVFCISMVITLVTGSVQYNNFVKKKLEMKDYSVNYISSSFTKWTPVGGEAKASIKQTFYTSKPFNHISLQGKANGKKNGKYRVIIEQKEKTLYSCIVSAKDIKKNSIDLKFKAIVPHGRKEYGIQIINMNKENTESIAWAYRLSRASDNYPGRCFRNNKRQKSDLLMRVYNSYETTYLKESHYYLGMIILIALEVLVFMLAGTWKNRKFIIHDTHFE